MALQDFAFRTASFVRWDLKVTRFLEFQLNRILNFRKAFNKKIAFSPNYILDEMENNGFCKLNESIYVPEIDFSSLKNASGGAAFVDVSARYEQEVLQVFEAVMQVDGVEDTVCGYFGGRPWLWNIALNYSDPCEEGAEETSQLWHFDYGDRRQLHMMIYFSDVTEKSGPFTFLPMQYSQRIGRSIWRIERFTDDSLKKTNEIDAEAQRVCLTGKRGDVYLADPGKLLHQGARSHLPRLVMFITFTSLMPMSKGGRSTMSD